ncbi:methyltransferase [Colletotrichum kahawae]|uniref:Methyltransferase n=1 Tax=Colletotrichum kahawae TaxID=34407 RepID=A0AAD9XXJ6_COLKA|nr:methyltransferase [Colletotrichum kahawae]
MEGYIKYTKDRDGNKSESARLRDQHDVLLHAMGNRAVLAPVDFSRRYLRILDCGAGDGRWLFDFRQYLDRHGADAGTYHYVGTDINPTLYPKSLPPHIEFFNQSILESFPAKWHGTFDIVHQRLVMAAVAPPATTIASVVAELGGLLRPGGWLQLVELDNDCTPESGPALRRLLDYHQQNSAAGGLGPNLSVHLKTAMEDIGLEHIRQDSVDVFYGAKNQGGAELMAKSTRSLSQVVGPVLAQARVAVPNTYNKSDEVTLPSQLQKEVEDVGARLRFTVVYGQRGITS